MYTERDVAFLKTKVATIAKLFLNSEVPPKLRVGRCNALHAHYQGGLGPANHRLRALWTGRCLAQGINNGTQVSICSSKTYCSSDGFGIVQSKLLASIQVLMESVHDHQKPLSQLMLTGNPERVSEWAWRPNDHLDMGPSGQG
ncbi:hypothetical protein KIL84_016143 [Mauremys mutica]|uniref:Uncharacterized protein n=1 Tax=Mauremys mutica TaxID=74926 RepID=A0A9D3WS57_9SAUR|nr:hypothetical protein KIL84_016143 [Mauremys mutica]